MIFTPLQRIAISGSKTKLHEQVPCKVTSALRIAIRPETLLLDAVRQLLFEPVFRVHGPAAIAMLLHSVVQAIMRPLGSSAVRCGSPNSYRRQKSDYESGVVRRICVGCLNVSGKVKRICDGRQVIWKNRLPTSQALLECCADAAQARATLRTRTSSMPTAVRSGRRSGECG